VLGQRNPERLSFSARRCHAQSLAAPAVDENVLEYCDISKRTRTLGEKEQDFLMALQSFYDTGVWACLRRVAQALAPSSAAPARRCPGAPRPTRTARGAARTCRPRSRGGGARSARRGLCRPFPLLASKPHFAPTCLRVCARSSNAPRPQASRA
jgi:hypothetical protein